MKTLRILVLFLCFASLSNCYYDKFNELHPLDGFVNTCSADLPDTYSASIDLILRSNCVSCHNSKLKSGDIGLETYAEVKALALNGKLSGSILHQPGFQPMPPGTSIRDCEIQKIQHWITTQMPE